MLAPISAERPFVPSAQLATALLVARGLRLDAVAQMGFADVVVRAVEGALAAWAYYSALPNAQAQHWLLCDERLDDSFAAWLLSRLRAPAAAAPELLARIIVELQWFLAGGAIKRPWGSAWLEHGNIRAELLPAPPRNELPAKTGLFAANA